jgi:hypothetical protein
MSFMAVAYIPAYIEDRSLYIKERANGLYGPTSFMVSNFIIGLPFLCKHSLYSTYISDTASHHHNPLFRRRILALQLSSHGRSILDVGPVALSRPRRSRVAGRAHYQHLPHIRGISCGCGFCKRAVDVGERIYGTSTHSQCILEIRVSFYRLPGICVSGYDGK